MDNNLTLLERLEEEHDIEFVEDFMTFLSVFCDSLEPIIIDLENPAKYTDKINELFRMFHNMKSASGYLGINQIVNVCRLVEDVLDEARTLSGPASEELIDWLLIVSDQFINYKKDYDNNKYFLTILNSKIIAVPERLNKSI